MMNKCYSIGDLMSMYYEREFAAVEQMPIPKLSSKHNRKMKKAFRIFAENSMSINNQPISGSIQKRNMLRILLILCPIYCRENVLFLR